MHYDADLRKKSRPSLLFHENLRYHAEIECLEADMGEKKANLRINADTNPSLGSSIRSRRRVLNLTQENLSDISGVSLRLVHEIEHGKDVVQLATLIKILSCLGLHLQLSIGAADAVTIDPAIAALGHGEK